MNSGKPKPAKLWKNSVKGEKKQKPQKKKFKRTSDNFEENTPSKNDFEMEDNVDLNTSKQNFKRKSQSPGFSSNKKRKTASGEGSENNSLVKKKKKGKREGNKDEEASQNTPNKIVKPADMSRKDFKMLHLNKKDKKSKETTHPKVMNKKGAWKELHMKEKGKTEVLETGKTLKALWEELRCEDCKPERRSELLKQVCNLIKGRVKEFVFAHDTVRVLETVLALGNDTQRSYLFDEIKGDIILLAKSKYGKFILIKMLKYGSKIQKDEIMKAFHGKVIKLLRNKEAATIVDEAFNECANAVQRFELLQEFFGPSYKFFKVSEVHSLKDFLEANPDKKEGILKNMKEELTKVLEKSAVKYSIVHQVLWQFMKFCDETSKTEIIESLKEVVPEILHTKDGSRVGMHCVWYGSNKDRKVIVKSMKRFVTKIAMEEFGHMVLLAIFDVVDDTLLVEKYIVKELIKSMSELSQNVHGKKLLIHLLSPRDPRFFHPDVVNILKVGDDNKVSKKDPEVRRSEFKAMISEPLLQLIKSNIQELHTQNPFCLFTCTILDHTVSNKEEALQAIADLLVEPYTSENKNTHPVEHPGSSFMFKQLIIRDQHAKDDDCSFSEVLIDKLPKSVMSSWVDCNRGAFLLVNLIETNKPRVVERVKKELEGRNKYLMKKNFEGARILLKKLKNSPSCK